MAEGSFRTGPDNIITFSPRCKERYTAGTLGALRDDSSRLQIGTISFSDNLIVMTDTDTIIYVKINRTSWRSVKPTN